MQQFPYGDFLCYNNVVCVNMPVDKGKAVKDTSKGKKVKPGITQELEFLDLGLDEENVVNMHVSDDTGSIQLESFDLTETEYVKGDLFDTESFDFVDLDDHSNLTETGTIIFSNDEKDLDISSSKNLHGSNSRELDFEDLDSEDLNSENTNSDKKTSAKAKPTASSVKAHKKAAKAGFFERVSGLQLAMGGIGVLLLVAAATVVILMLGKKGNAGLDGEQLANAQLIESISPAGLEGMERIAADRISRYDFAETTEDEFIDEPAEEIPEEVVATANVDVKVSFTSVEKDLKIKFLNSSTGKLVNNARFDITLTSDSGKTLNFTDDDMDGMIYQSSMTPGKYKVSVNAPEGFLIASCDGSVTVKDKIEYKKIDVADEIKDQAQVAASEDKGNVASTSQEAVTGTLKDTVEYVESSSSQIETTATYSEVSKDTIANPDDLAAALVNINSAFLAGDEVSPVPTPDATEDNKDDNESTPTPTPEETRPTEITPEETPTPSPADTPTPSPTDAPSPSPSPSVSPSPSPTTTPSPSPSISPSPSVTPTATPTAAPSAVISKLSVDASEITVFTERKKTIVATVTVDGKEYKSSENKGYVTFESSDSAIVKVNSETGEAEGVKAGSAKITVTSVNKNDKGEKLTATVKVTVKSNPEKNTTDKLKNKSGEQVYIQKSDGNYVEATYADYYTASKFFVKNPGTYSYTGWQTIDNKRYYYTKDGVPVTGKQVIQGVEYTFDSSGALYTGNAVFGIDVSKWNGSIDWNAVKASGVEFVIIRCGFRGSSVGGLVEDTMFKKNIQGATNAGLKVGVYFFSQAINEVEAVEEASACLSLVSGYKLAYPIFIDTEACNGRADKIDKATRTAVCNAFCQTIRNGGYKAGIYASKSWFIDKINTSSLSGNTIWVAQYATALTYTGHYDMWQYSSKGKVSGISGDVDLNYCYAGY